ncbi:putative tricarboxylic transport membrane protein [Rhodopseudomonas julia]|uniref:Tricarboxylic transport membrane protein n=1 Tax=Rhodopseudomonas julia TaxID=200617 RepID=A0ABU0CA85_9BRAD|nr:tripartite tricarboxylate transporter TctB family protein [Rhodopseudomonas julia]MDQ0327445.1 putative tricarboxylic transport membrane protein [Rhodopseudomonas julia]
MSDRILGVIGIALAAFYIWQATLIQESFMSDPVGPKTFPIIIGVILGLSSIYFVIKPDPEPQWASFARTMEVLFAAAVLFGYAYALPIGGFVLTTAVTAMFLSWRLGAGPVQAAIAGATISVGIYVLFGVVLGLSLAHGPWGF